MITQLEKQTAEELLYGSALPTRESSYLGSEEVLTKFNYGHNFGAYEQLVQNKYADAPAVAPKMDSYVVEKNVYTAPAEPQQSYFAGVTTDNRTIPYQTFRPKIFEYEDFVEPAPVVDSTLEEIATVNVIEQPTQFAEPVFQPDVVPHFSLNAKGIITVATFAAVIVLMTVMLIINSVAISGGTAAINKLAQSNNEISSMLYDGPDSLMQQRNEAYEYGMNRVDGLKNTPGYGPSEQVRLPSLPPAPNLNMNPDYSTNLFDQIVKFISNIFG